MSLALFVSYAFVAIFIAIIGVLFCLGCQCSIPLRKIVRWIFSARCCQCPHRTEREEEEYNQVQTKQARSTESDYAQCVNWVPFVLTCGYCFGQCSETMDTRARPRARPRAPLPRVVAQPVALSEVDDAVEATGTEAIVSIQMPLLKL
jgi:hypothetical protein